MVIIGFLQTLGVFTSLSAIVVAQNPAQIAGPFSPGPVTLPEASEAFAAAVRQPNATSEVSFSRTFNNTAETWLWRINITELDVPDVLDDYGSESASFSRGRRIVNTQWQLDWPGDSNDLQSFLEPRNMSFSFQALIANKPANVTDSYDPTDEGDCSSLLGEECAQSLVQAASEDSGAVGLAGLSGCEDTLNARSEDSADRFSTGVAWDLNPASTYEPGDSLFFSASVSSPTANLSDSEFDMAAQALQLFIMRPLYGPGPRGESDGATVLCRIVDNAVADNSEDDEPPESSAPRHGQIATAAVFGFAVLVAMALM